MFPDDPMLERAVAHVLGCKDDVDKAREASKMFAALMKKVCSRVACLWPRCCTANANCCSPPPMRMRSVAAASRCWQTISIVPNVARCPGS